MKRERELKEQEERTIAELQERHRREAKETKRLRLAKLASNERVQEAIECTRQRGLSPLEIEDGCLRATIGHQMPEVQMMDAVGLIQKERHDRETTELLTRRFDKRVPALKQAVVLEDTSAIKLARVERLSQNGNSDEVIQSELLRLEAHFNVQLQAEKSATSTTRRGACKTRRLGDRSQTRARNEEDARHPQPFADICYRSTTAAVQVHRARLSFM